MSECRPDCAALADRASNWKSAYVHVPFCRRRCPYCDFAIVDESVDGSLGSDEYVEALVAEIGMESDFGPLDSINLGGGTPSRLSPDQLHRIVDVLCDRFGLEPDGEVSLEVNPEDWTDDFGEGLLAAGFTRVSIGAQSFDALVLDALGRLHTADMIESTVVGARTAGIQSVGLDLIFGHPSETSESWASTVDAATHVGVDHISTYALTVEAGTQLSREIMTGAAAPDDDVQADRYRRFEEAAGAAGFVRYEISNHAQPGHECRYNLATWAHGEYVAFGIGAHSHRLGLRERNHRRADRYMESISAGERPTMGVEHLSPADQERDRLMVGLRLTAGTPLTDTAQRFVDSSPGQRFVDAGLLSVDNNRVIITDPMLSDTVIREALSVSAGDC